MLRKILLSSVLIAAAAGSAAAADLPYRTAAPAPYVAAPVFTWTGFYVGLNAGASFNNSRSNYSAFGFPAGAGVTVLTGVGSLGGNNDTGFTGGAQAGYNMQFGSFVAGVEADINYIDRSNGSSVLITNTGTTGTGDTYRLTRGDANNYYGTLRGRLGFAFDRFLVFGTGGLAWGGKQGGVSGVFTPNLAAVTPSTGTGGAMLSSNNDGSSTGWALGGGVEYAFSNSMSLKVEYLHVDLGSKTRSVAVNGATTRGFDVSGNNKFDVVRAGVNFRF